MELIVLIIIWIVLVILTISVASDKGYSPRTWALAVIFFGPLAFLAALGLPDLKQRKYLRLLLEHYGVSVETTAPAKADDMGDADAQRRRILGSK